MVARHWRGWTNVEDADGYERFLKEKVMAGLASIEGYKGGYVLRGDGEEAEFVVVNFFESLEAVKRFAGPDYTTPVFEPEAKRFLSRIEPFAAHYEVRACTVPGVVAEGIRARAEGLKLGEFDWTENKAERDEGRP
jgi:heme-degrading monooxygenase HmoA